MQLELLDKLCRETAQSEYDAHLHTRRHARRLGDCPPGDALVAISQHAEAAWPRFVVAASLERGLGIELARWTAMLFSNLRHFALDRIIDAQRAYRATLLGLVHGIDCARLMRQVALLRGERALVTWCDDVIPEREDLLQHASRALLWFASEPAVALRASSRTREIESTSSSRPDTSVI